VLGCPFGIAFTGAGIKSERLRLQFGKRFVSMNARRERKRAARKSCPFDLAGSA